MVLGQEQDSLGGGFQTSQSFQGMLSNVNVWDEVLAKDEIKNMSKSCLIEEWDEANVYKWPDFLRQGGAKLVTPSSCKPFATSGRWLFIETVSFLMDQINTTQSFLDS